MNGYIVNPTQHQRVRNLADIIGSDVATYALAVDISEGDPHEFERILTGLALDAQVENYLDHLAASIEGDDIDDHRDAAMRTGNM